MLVLPNANGFGVYFSQFGRGRQGGVNKLRPHRYILVRKFITPPRSRVNQRPSLTTITECFWAAVQCRAQTVRFRARRYPFLWQWLPTPWRSQNASTIISASTLNAVVREDISRFRPAACPVCSAPPLCSPTGSRGQWPEWFCPRGEAKSSSRRLSANTFTASVRHLFG